MSENKLGVGIIGQMYEDRKSGKTGKLIETNEKFRTLMFEGEDGKTFSISAGTFKSNWRKKKDVEPITESTDTVESEPEISQTDDADTEMPREESESSDSEEEFKTDDEGFYTDDEPDEEVEEKPKKKRGRKSSKKTEEKPEEPVYTEEELAYIKLFEGEDERIPHIKDDSIYVNDVPFVIIESLSDDLYMVKLRLELNYECDWSELDAKLVNGPAYDMHNKQLLQVTRLYKNINMEEIQMIVKDYIEWFCNNNKKEEN